MHLFVWEALSAGAGAGENAPPSLFREGHAMLAALLEDAASLPDGKITTLLAGKKPFSRTAERPAVPSGIEIYTAWTAEEERQLFRRLCSTAECTWLIAPEIDHLLLHRTQQALAAGGRTSGPNIPALRLCSDKYRLARFCRQQGIPTLTTWLPAEVPATPIAGSADFALPVVLKPRFGAGSTGCRLVASRREWEEWQQQRRKEQQLAAEWIVQPYVAGRALSTAAIFSPPANPDGFPVPEIFPVGEQLLSQDGRFRYEGGRIPADLPETLQMKAEQLIRKVGRRIRGLYGYVGFDLLLPESDAEELLLVEINPRLTTAYLGYRRLCEENLTQRVLTPTTVRPLRWSAPSVSVRFSPEGRLRQIGQPKGPGSENRTVT